jgi:hypothetical protein
MAVWTDAEFQRVALDTRLSKRTLAACRSVLVDGMTGVEAGELHSMVPAQISRGLGPMRDRRDELRAMTLLSEGEFQRLAVTARLAPDAMSACQAVLVGGMRVGDVAALHGIASAHILREVGAIHDMREEMIRSAEAMRDPVELMKFTAAAVAKNMVGEGLTVADAQAGKEYVGRTIVNTHGFAVQQVGHTGVLHDHGKLNQVPPLKVLLTIAYPKDGGIATVSENALLRESAKSLSR